MNFIDFFLQKKEDLHPAKKKSSDFKEQMKYNLSIKS